MSPAAWGVVTHQAVPVRRFSAMMAGDVGSITPCASDSCAPAGRDVVVVDPCGRVVGAAPTVLGWEPVPPVSTSAPMATPATTVPPAAAQPRNWRRLIVERRPSPSVPPVVSGCGFGLWAPVLLMDAM